MFMLVQRVANNSENVWIYEVGTYLMKFTSLIEYLRTTVFQFVLPFCLVVCMYLPTYITANLYDTCDKSNTEKTKKIMSNFVCPTIGT